jgi:4-hydroxybenzoate polyprenyltransferase
VSVTQALVFTGMQTVASLYVLAWLPPVCALYAVPAIAGWIFYPLAKRVTYYPQVVLGFPMAWGVFMGAAAMGADPLGLSALLSVTDVRELVPALAALRLRDPALSAFYAANVLWTLLYEIIYSHQDAREDSKAGVKNIVLLYAKKKVMQPEVPQEKKQHQQRQAEASDIEFGTMPLLVWLGIFQVLFLTVASPTSEPGGPYIAGTVAGGAAATATVLSRVNLDIPADCAWWFRVGCCGLVGGAMGTGLLLEYAVRWLQG